MKKLYKLENNYLPKFNKIIKDIQILYQELYMNIYLKLMKNQEEWIKLESI